jgi:hypothetical protein
MNTTLSDSVNSLGSVSADARIFLLVCGVVLCLWVVLELRKRKLLVSISLLFFTLSLSFLLFALVPSLFNQAAYMVGIKYPPLLYLILAIIAVMVLAGHLASRLSLVDERCRRLAQEIALMKTPGEQENSKGNNA